MISLFMTFSASTGEWRIHPDEVAAVAVLVGSIPDMTEGLLFTPLEKSVDHRAIPWPDDIRAALMAHANEGEGIEATPA